MPVSDLHRQVAAVALTAAREYGFALGGGNALLAHGVISRPTQDVDLFTDQEHGVPAAADAVEAALRGADFEVERLDQDCGLSDTFPDIGEGLAEWVVTAPGGEEMLLQLAYFERGRDPVVMDLGPVLHLEDAVGGKVSALASRAEPRDYANVAAALDRYSMDWLIGLARRLDPGLTGEDLAYAGSHLDRMDDRVFAEIGLSHGEIIACGTGSPPGPVRPGPRARNPSPALAQPGTCPGTKSRLQSAALNRARARRTLAAGRSSSSTNRLPKPDGTTRRPSHDRPAPSSLADSRGERTRNTSSRAASPCGWRRCAVRRFACGLRRRPARFRRLSG
jgi:hypothetical protein